MTNLRNGSVQPNPNVQNTDILSITMPMINRMKVEDKAESTITSYVRAVERLVRFHGLTHPKDLDIDEVLDFLVSLNEKEQINWRTNKMYPDDEYQELLSQDSDITGITSSKIKNLPTVFLILKNSLACLRSSVGKNLPSYLTLVITLNIESYLGFYIHQDCAEPNSEISKFVTSKPKM